MKSKPRSGSKDSLPIKPVLDDLAFLLRTLREVLTHYGKEIEGRILQIASLVRSEGEQDTAPPERVKELRDMLILMRSLDVKPKKGRRRDLKQIEALLDELRAIVERW